MLTRSDWARCGNVASILELDESLQQEYKVFQHAPTVRDPCLVYFSALLIRIPSAGHEVNTGKTTPTAILPVTARPKK